MREIKFRVWDIHHNKMLDDLNFDKAVSLNEALKSNEDFIILEYTGLQDMNNKKIYADSSICRVNYFGNHLDLINAYCYFYFDTENLRYTVRFINERQIVDYESSSFDSIEIVDTLQENKLGLIK